MTSLYHPFPDIHVIANFFESIRVVNVKRIVKMLICVHILVRFCGSLDPSRAQISLGASSLMYSKDLLDVTLVCDDGFFLYCFHWHCIALLGLSNTGCFLTGTPPNNSKYKKVNLG